MKLNPALIFLLIGMLLWFGCSSTQVQYSGKRIQADDLAFVVLGQTTRPEFEAKLGKPWMHYLDLNVSVYYWEVVRSRFYQNMSYGLAGGEQTLLGPSTRIELLCVAYDANARVAKWAIMPQPEKRTTKEIAAAWVTSAKATSP